MTLVLQASLDASASENALFLIAIPPGVPGHRVRRAAIHRRRSQPRRRPRVASGSLPGTYAYVLLSGTGMAPGGSMDLVLVSIPRVSPGTPFGAALASFGSYGEGEALFVPEPAGATPLAVRLALAGGRRRASRTRA